MNLEDIRNIAAKNKGMIKTGELSRLGIDYRGIQRLIRDGEITKVKNGLYRLKSGEMSEEELVAGLFPDGVLCMITAMYYHGYTQVPPLSWNIAVNKDTSKSRFKIEYPFIKPYFTEEEQLMVGAEKGSFGSASFYVYNKERMICDFLKFENKMERSLFNQGIRKYIEDTDKNPERLYEYAAVRRVYKKAKDVLGIWI